MQGLSRPQRARRRRAAGQRAHAHAEAQPPRELAGARHGVGRRVGRDGELDRPGEVVGARAGRGAGPERDVEAEQAARLREGGREAAAGAAQPDHRAGPAGVAEPRQGGGAAVRERARQQHQLGVGHRLVEVGGGEEAVEGALALAGGEPPGGEVALDGLPEGLARPAEGTGVGLAQPHHAAGAGRQPGDAAGRGSAPQQGDDVDLGHRAIQAQPPAAWQWWARWDKQVGAASAARRVAATRPAQAAVAAGDGSPSVNAGSFGAGRFA